MNATLITTFLRQRLASPIRLVFMSAALFFPLLFVAAAPAMGFSPLQDSFGFALIAGAGMIGQDVSSGVIQLLLARPVRRSEYLLSRWIAASLAAGLAAVMQVGLAALILTARGAAPSFGDVAIACADHLTSAFGATAPLALFSTLVPGLGDAGLVLLCTISSKITASVSGMLHWTVLARIAGEIDNALGPAIDFRRVIAPSPAWYPVLAYASTVTLCLALAIVILNRKELSYASG